MQELFQQIREQVTRAWETLNIQQKILFVSIPVALLVILSIAVYYVSRPNYVSLITTEDQAHLERVRQFLDAQGYKYEVTPAGTGIRVDDRVKARVGLELAGQGLLGFDAGVGFELFDEIRLGMTDRQFDLQSRRATENTLARYVVEGSQRITFARVNINPGRSALFSRDQIEPSASVKVGYRGELSREEVQGIQRFVAAAVVGLRREAVEVMDQNMRPLTEDSAVEPGVAMATKQMELRLAVENDIRRKLEDKLRPIVGPENYNVIVTANLDWERRHREEIGIEIDSPAPISTRNYEESSTARGIAGAPGVASNVQDTGIGADTEITGTEIEEELINYQYPWSKTIIEKSQGMIEDLFVAVTINYIRDPATGDRVPRSADVIQDWERNLRLAAGLPDVDPPGSPVSFDLLQAPFDESLQQEIARQQFWETVTGIVQTVLPLILLLAVGYLAYLFFQRAFAPPEIEEEDLEEAPIEPVTDAKELTLSQLGLAEFGDIASLPAEEQRRLKMQEHVINYAQEKPEEVAAIIRAWLAS